MHVTRRYFLKGMGTLAGVAAAGVNINVVASTAAEAMSSYSALEGVKYVKSTCCHCVNFCGLNVKMQNGTIRAIYPDKDRADYFNWGVCPKGIAGIFNTYNPYRLRVPLKRTNPQKGLNQDPRWVEISWDGAFSIIVEKLRKIKQKDPRKLIWQHGHGKYLIQDKFPKAFADAFGTPNLIHRTTACEAARHVADELTWGYHGFLPDLEHCNMLLNFGGNYFEAGQWARWLDHATTMAKERGMKVVVVEPRLSHCAAKADEWIPIRPGKDVVFLLAMAKILINKGLIDEKFLVNYTNSPNLVGGDDKFLLNKEGKPLLWDNKSRSAKPFVEGVSPALKGAYRVNGKTYRTAFQMFAESLKDITLEYAEKVCGVPAETIERLSREVGKEAKIGSTILMEERTLRYRPVVIYTYRGLSAKEFGVQNWRAGLIVQMLLGNIDAVGGLHLHSVYKKPKYLKASRCVYPPKRIDLQESVYFPHAHHNVCQQVALTQLNPKEYGLEYEPDVQIIYATNRPFSTSDAQKQFEALKKTYNVVIDIVMTETAWMADIVLPDLTYLEAWHFSSTRWTPGSRHTAIRQPMTNVYNLPHDGWSILWELAKRLGIRDKYTENINAKFKLQKYKFEPGRDYTPREAVEILWKEKTQKPFSYAQEHAFVGKKLSAEDRYIKGVEANFKGPDKPKMHFYTEQLVHTFEKVKNTVKRYGINNIDLAKYEVALSSIPRKEHAFPTPHRETKGYPFYLITYKRMYRNQSGNTAQNPILNALGPDENFIDINRSTAKRMGIQDKDLLIVETRVGNVEGKARLTEGIRPDTVAVSYHYGQWSPSFPRYARKGIWINQVLELHSDVVSGMNSFNDTKCKVYKA
jgi:phenylacetyl-CoA:acceptor oxidoreductase